MLRQVSPFRYLRIDGCLRLPEAFRSLPRLSSAPSAKAFSLCSFLLDQFNIAISLECFVVAIQLLLHLKIENFVFSIDSIFALLVFSFQGASCFEGLILQNRTMNIFHNLALKMSAKNHSYNFVVLMCLLHKLTLQFIVVLPCKQCIPTKIPS